jgi:hypothetical protein
MRRSPKRSSADPGPPQQRLHPDQQLLEGERLDQVVVGAGLEPGHPLGDLAAGGQHEHGHLAGLAQPPAHLEAVDAGQEHVEDDQVGRVVEGPAEGLLAGGGHLDLEPLVGQRAAKGRGQEGVVVDDQDVCAHALPPMDRPPSGRRSLDAALVPFCLLGAAAA